MTKSQKDIIKLAASNLCDELNNAAEWVFHSYKIIPNGFEIYDDGHLTQKYIFNFNKNIYTVYDKSKNSWKEWKSFYINPDFSLAPIECGNHMDRDLNAAINLKNEAIKQYKNLTL